MSNYYSCKMEDTCQHPTYLQRNFLVLTLKDAANAFNLVRIRNSKDEDLQQILNLVYQLFESQSKEVKKKFHLSVINNFLSLLETDSDTDESFETYECSVQDDTVSLQKELFEAERDFDMAKMTEAYRLKHTQNWERTRISQNYIKLNMVEQDLYLTEKSVKDGIIKETQISSELVRHLENAISEVVDRNIAWEERIMVDTEELELSEQKFYDRRNKFEQRKVALTEAFEVHKEVLARHAAALEQERQLRIMTRATRKIQAWWRATMKRKKLGPYRPKRKQKKKPKKKR